MRKLILLVLMMVTASLACTLTLEEQPTSTPLPPTFTPNPTVTTVAIEPTASSTTPIDTNTLVPSLTPTEILPTPTASNTPLPTATPLPPITLAYDLIESVEIDSDISGGLDTVWISYRNINDRDSSVDVRTPQADTGLQTIYMYRPRAQRVRVMDVPSSVEDNIFWSPNGQYMLYFVNEGPGVFQSEVGLYLLDIRLGVSVRLFNIDSLQPAGLSGHKPNWSADSGRFVMVLESQYATDAFVLAPDGSIFRNISNSPAYDFWATWSPDGTKIAFVSDRNQCPSRQPSQVMSCTNGDQAPIEGNLFIYDINSEDIQQVTDTVVSGPPTWLDNRFITTTTGFLDPLATAIDVWMFDTVAGTAWQANPEDNAVYPISAWYPALDQIAFQRAASSTSILLTDEFGELISEIDRYNFPRLGMAMDWSPDGNYLAIGGRSGQCPYGLIVLNEDFETVTAPVTNVLACDPVYSANGEYVAYEGIRPQPGTDARQDVYIANPNGLGSINITSTLRGQVHLIGWVGFSE